MKKSLEESRDWQGAGDFYRGEMHAKIRLLESREEQYWYRKTLCFYRIISAFGESAKRILIVMGLTFIIGNFSLAFFKPELSFFEIIEKNVGFFLPIFGNNAYTIKSLNMLPWQDVVVQFEIM